MRIMRMMKGTKMIRNWRKSSFSNPSGNSVEVADYQGGKAVRDSKHPKQAALMFDAAEWQAFVLGVKNGEFD